MSTTTSFRRSWRSGAENANQRLGAAVFGIQDAALTAENMVIAARSLGLEATFWMRHVSSEKIAKKYRLPGRVFLLVQLVMGCRLRILRQDQDTYGIYTFRGVYPELTRPNR
ncbi:hypothetical protein KEJ37_04960 [Candidatus Bathyarchaeota archaeon]|nr:hypothetical protein [Candidatus Bathyarchaeota archaeon]